MFPSEDFWSIASIPSFTRTAIIEDAKNNFNQLSLYAWDGHLYWSVEAKDLSSILWQYTIPVSDYDITYYGLHRKVEAKWSWHLSEVVKGMLALPSGSPVEADVDVYICRFTIMASFCTMQIFVHCQQKC